MKRRILALVVVLVAFFGMFTAVPAATADTPCTKIWLTAPSFHRNFETGERRCVWPDDKLNGWAKIYRSNNRANAVVDYVYQYTRIPPNDGRVLTTARAARDLARKYHVDLQFSNRDLIGRMGCSGVFSKYVTGTYAPSSQYPGEGLIRLGTGKIKRCMYDKTAVLNVLKHEISHALINRVCGTTRPPMATGGGRMEDVTTAYGFKYLGATSNSGRIGHTVHDTRRATNIHNGNCG